LQPIETPKSHVNVTPETLLQIENDLSQPSFRGVSIGSALASLWFVELYNGNADWSFRHALKNRGRYYYHFWRAARSRPQDVSFCRGRVLVTCILASLRCWDLVFPLIKQFGPDRCAVLYADSKVAALMPAGFSGLEVGQVMDYDVSAWRRDFRRFWGEMKPSLRRVSRQFDFPDRVYCRLADAMVSCTQLVAGLREFLRRAQPAAIVTDFDRNDVWAPLVLAARTLGIPTYTLLHGVIGQQCVGYYPLLADTVFCWGQMARKKFLDAGVAAERTVLGGCPRLTRDLPAQPAEARRKRGLVAERPLVMLATAPYQHFRRSLAETFCQAVSGQEMYSAVVRLHPAEKLADYAELIARFPGVKFLPGEGWPVDEALAAADVVVVHSSGFGSDALVKRRLVVVLDAIDFPLGHGQDLLDFSGCPRACSAGELRDVLRRLFCDQQEQAMRRQSGEQFVRQFCDAFGAESAARIAEYVLARIPQAGSPARAGCHAE
jgi:hypothetical protein